MAKKYKLPSDHFLRVDELPSVAATELKNKTADVLDRVTEQGALAIRRHDKPRAVLMSMEQYDALTSGGDPFWLDELKAKYNKMLDDMQSPESKAAAERAFNATPEELGEAAVRGAQRMIESGEIKL